MTAYSLDVDLEKYPVWQLTESECDEDQAETRQVVKAYGLTVFQAAFLFNE